MTTRIRLGYLALLIQIGLSATNVIDKIVRCIQYFILLLRSLLFAVRIFVGDKIVWFIWFASSLLPATPNRKSIFCLQPLQHSDNMVPLLTVNIWPEHNALPIYLEYNKEAVARKYIDVRFSTFEWKCVIWRPHFSLSI